MKKIYSILSVLCLSLLAASCSSDMLDEAMTQDKGYLKLDVTTLVSTNTKAVTPKPGDYNPKTIAVKITDSTGKVVMQTDDVANDDAFKGNIVLAPGKYTITGSSAGWDGSDSAFGAPYYAGTTSVTISAKTLTQGSLVLTQANVKVTVKYSDNFRQYFSQAICIITSQLEEVAVQRFSLNTVGSAYFPVAPLNFLLNVTNNAGDTYAMSNDITEVNARDHFIINYKLADTGNMGGVKVEVDDETQTYTFNIEIPRKSSIALEASPANAWSTFADLAAAVTAKTTTFDESNLTLQWKKQDATEWNDVAASALVKGSNDNYTYRLRGLEPGVAHVYRLAYDDGENRVNSNEVKFTTEECTAIQNAGFENWKVTEWHTTSLYEPFSREADQWWDVNSKVSMPDYSYATYPCFKCMPTVTYSNNNVHSGSASAQVSTINIGGGNSTWATTGDWHVGELFIGDADSNGNKASSGHAFTSRPSAVSFWYQFDAHSDSDRFGVEASIADASGNTIASASVTDGPISSSWQKMVVPLSYSNGNAKAASIYISFKASTSSSHSCSAGGNWIEIAGVMGSGDKERIKLSSMLRIDDVELIYE